MWELFLGRVAKSRVDCGLRRDEGDEGDEGEGSRKGAKGGRRGRQGRRESGGEKIG